MATFLEAAIIFVLIVAIVLILVFFACFFLEPFYSSKDENDEKEYWVEDTSLDDDFDVDYE